MFQYLKNWGARKRLKIFLDTNPRGLMSFNDLVKVIKLPQINCLELVIEQIESKKLFQYVKLHDTIYNSILDIPNYFTDISSISVVYSTNKIK